MSLNSISVNQEKGKYDWLWYTTIFLFSINLFAKANYLIIFILFVGLFLVEYKKTRFKLSLSLVLLFLFSLSYYLILTNYKSTGINGILIYLIGPGALFFIGYFIVNLEKKFIVNTIYSIILGNFLHGFLNMILYFSMGGFNSLVRRVPDIWTGVKMAATLQGTHFTLMSSLLFFNILIYKKSKRKVMPTILLFGIIFSVYTSLILGNRTIILITLLVFGINVISYLFLNRNKFYRSIKNISTLTILGVLIWASYSNNILGIKEFILNSNLYLRMEQNSLTDDPRMEVLSRVFGQMFLYPFGGYQMNIGLEFAHNMWIDVLFATGLIPCFFLILFTLITLVSLISVLKNREIDIWFKLLILSVYAGYILNFMVEPILEGVPYMFLSFCLLTGMIKKYNDTTKMKSLNH